MYIREIHIKNFSIHRDTKVALSPLTVFVGPNGGGKSALFDALLNFSNVSRGNIRQTFNRYPYSFRATLSRGASPTARITFKVEFAEAKDSSESLSYMIEYAQTGFEYAQTGSEDSPIFTIINERLVKEGSDNPIFDRSEPPEYIADLLANDRSYFAALRQAVAAGRELEIDPLVAHCTKMISRFNRFRLEPSVLAQPSRRPEIDTSGESSPTPPWIGYSGDGLAGTLYFMGEIKAPEFDLIKERLRAIEPAFEDFEFNMLGPDKVGFSVTFSDNRGTIAAPRLSSGFLSYLGLSVLVTAPNRPAVMMIEEPENGLTPQAIKAFYQSLKALVENTDVHKRSQVLISSHSPFVICEAWNGEDRNFIQQVKISGGKSQIRKFQEVIDDQKIQLQKDPKGDRTFLGLRTAEEIMSGRFS